MSTEVGIDTLIHLKSGIKLYYVADGSEGQVQLRWREYLRNSDGCVSFGQFVVPKSEIQYVEIMESTDEISDS